MGIEHIISWTIVGSDKFTVVKVFEKRTQDLINLREEKHPCFVGFLSFTRTLTPQLINLIFGFFQFSPLMARLA